MPVARTMPVHLSFLKNLTNNLSVVLSGSSRYVCLPMTPWDVDEVKRVCKCRTTWSSVVSAFFLGMGKSSINPSPLRVERKGVSDFY